MPLILLAIGLGLIIYNYRVINKKEKIKQVSNEVEISFERVLEENKEEIDDYKIEIGLLRKDIAESLTELQEEILEIKNNVNEIKKSEKLSENKEKIKITDLQDDKLEGEEDSLIKDMDETLKENIESDIELQDDFEIKEKIISEINFTEQVDSNKTQSIKRLLEDGLTEEQICHELSVSKGEVLLVKGLFKK